MQKEEEKQRQKEQYYNDLLRFNKQQLDQQVKFKIRKQRLDERHDKKSDELTLKMIEDSLKEQEEKKKQRFLRERQFFESAMKQSEQEEAQRKVEEEKEKAQDKTLTD